MLNSFFYLHKQNNGIYRNNNRQHIKRFCIFLVLLFLFYFFKSSSGFEVFVVSLVYDFIFRKIYYFEDGNVCSACYQIAVNCNDFRYVVMTLLEFCFERLSIHVDIEVNVSGEN